MPAESASSSGSPSSTIEMALAMARRSPASTPSITDPTSTGRSLAVAGTRVGDRARGIGGSGARDRTQRVAERCAIRPLLDQRRVVDGDDLGADHREVHLFSLEAAEQP